MIDISPAWLWLRILLIFALSIGAQMLMYVPIWGGGPIWGVAAYLGGDVVYLLLFTFFCLGPAIIATMVARRMLRRRHFSGGRMPRRFAMFIIVVLAISSAYAGVFICFNKWGT